MALQIANYTTEHGVNLADTYWRWTFMNIDVPNNYLIVLLSGYVSAQAFAEGKVPIGTIPYTVRDFQFGQLVLSQPNGPTLSDVISNAVYDHVKQNDQLFQGAVEV